MAQQRGQSKAPDLQGYVEVKDRVAAFHREYPDGIIRTRLFEDGMPCKVMKMHGVVRDPRNGDLIMETAEETYILVVAEVRRKPDEEWVTASSMEQFPGRTPYTRNSELENAETSAWGRALAALGIGVDKSMASRTEVENRQAERQPEPQEAQPHFAPKKVVDTAQALLAINSLGDLITFMAPGNVPPALRRELIPPDVFRAPDGSLVTIGQLAALMKDDFEKEPRQVGPEEIQ